MEEKPVIYFAPLEGVGGYVYRNAFHHFFSGIEKYFTPFLAPGQNKIIGTKEQRDILPDNNRGMYVVPQILTNRSEYFIRTAKELEQEYGYREVNLNLGCPSGTVVSKGKGAGFLARKEELRIFLDEIFAALDMKISIKTRIGMEDPEEFHELLELYNRYPLHELIVHPRLQKDYYKNHADWNTYGLAAAGSRNPLCYNGDIFSMENYQKLRKAFPDTGRIMLGRGLLGDPMLAERILKAHESADAGEEQSGEEQQPAGDTMEENKTAGNTTEENQTAGYTAEEKERLRAFHDRLYADYRQVLHGDVTVLFKMKELWFYMIQQFPASPKGLKKIRKAGRLPEYEAAVRELLG